MGVNSYKHLINSFAEVVHTSGYCETPFKIINTGSNKYTIYAEYRNNKLRFKVDKHHCNGKYLGKIIITGVNSMGVEYRTTSLGRLPGSVTRYIQKLYSDLMRAIVG